MKNLKQANFLDWLQIGDLSQPVKEAGCGESIRKNEGYCNLQVV